MMKKFILFLWFTVLLPGLAAAQKGNIEGSVRDASNGQPLPGVNVLVKGTYKGAATDLNGKFKITGLSPGDYDLEARMIGFTTQLTTGVRVFAGRTKVVD